MTSNEKDSEKLQKVLARYGLGSRRQMEQWISAGRVQIGRQQAQLGDRVTAEDRIYVDGKFIRVQDNATQQTRVIVYNKPEGEICTRSDPEGRRTVFQGLPVLKKDRWIVVGRLDINTSGVLLFTNSGELAHRLMHPSFEAQREYMVRVLGTMDDEIWKNLLSGVALDDGVAKFDNLRFHGGEGANSWYHVVLHQGRYRLVRRLFEAQGLKVSRLIRIRFADVAIPHRLRSGDHHELDQAMVNELLTRCGVNVVEPQKKIDKRRK